MLSDSSSSSITSPLRPFRRPESARGEMVNPPTQRRMESDCAAFYDDLACAFNDGETAASSPSSSALTAQQVCSTSYPRLRLGRGTHGEDIFGLWNEVAFLEAARRRPVSTAIATPYKVEQIKPGIDAACDTQHASCNSRSVFKFKAVHWGGLEVFEVANHKEETRLLSDSRCSASVECETCGDRVLRRQVYAWRKTIHRMSRIAWQCSVCTAQGRSIIIEDEECLSSDCQLGNATDVEIEAPCTAPVQSRVHQETPTTSKSPVVAATSISSRIRRIPTPARSSAKQSIEDALGTCKALVEMQKQAAPAARSEDPVMQQNRPYSTEPQRCQLKFELHGVWSNSLDERTKGPLELPAEVAIVQSTDSPSRASPIDLMKKLQSTASIASRFAREAICKYESLPEDFNEVETV